MAKKSNSGGASIGVAAVAAAAAAYWLYGAKDAARHRKVAKSYMLKARAEAMDAVERVKAIDKTQYMAIVDKIVSKYGAVAGVTSAEVAQMTKDLRTAWNHMKAMHDKTARAVKPAKKAVKKAAKKKAKR